MSLPKPYYEDEEHGIVIYNADCREVLPHLPKVDLLLTDPPYGINMATATATSWGSKGGRKVWGGTNWDSERACPDLLKRLIAASTDAIIWGANYYPEAMPPGPGWLLWDKGQRIAQADGELAATTASNPLRVFTANRFEIAKDGSVHPTQKPLALMRWCLGFFPKAETVLDPFMGSGTTLVACKQLGRRCIGIEIEERYCEIAARRLSQGMLFGQDELAQIGGGK